MKEDVFLKQAVLNENHVMKTGVSKSVGRGDGNRKSATAKHQRQRRKIEIKSFMKMLQKQNGRKNANR